MRQGKKLTRGQKELLVKVELNPKEWRYYYEDKQYLHILSDNQEIKIIDKIGKVLVTSKVNQD